MFILRYIKWFQFSIINFIKVHYLIIKGVKINFPNSIKIMGKLEVDKGVELDRNIVFDGRVHLKKEVRIEGNCYLNNSTIGQNSEVRSNSIVEGSKVGSSTFIGPYARLREETSIGHKCQIGNFVEIKNSKIGSNCRINHMAFLGDAVLGDDVTIGAGTITCNHDGYGIHQTIIEQGAYVGSNVNLVAPVKILTNATIGSGSTITKDAPQGKLTLARANQSTIENWKGPKSKKDK